MLTRTVTIGAMAQTKPDNTEIVVVAFWLLACAAFAIGFWGYVLDELSVWIPITSPYWAGAGFIIVINACHFAWGFFHTSDDLSEVAPNRPGLMMSPWEHDRIVIRIIAFLTIAPSIYLQRLVELFRINTNQDDT